jgi:hypothetical protein
MDRIRDLRQSPNGDTATARAHLVKHVESIVNDGIGGAVTDHLRVRSVPCAAVSCSIPQNISPNHALLKGAVITGSDARTVLREVRECLETALFCF